MSGLPKAQLEQLKQFIEACRAQPDLLHTPDLAFFKDWLEGMGATLPPPAAKKQEPPKSQKKAPPAPEPEPEIESEESDIDLDNEGVVADAGEDEVPEYPDMETEVTEEMMDQSDELRGQATSALGDGNLEEALKLFNEAIQKNPGAAMLYAKRASVYIRMKKLKAAIHDCDKAISMNPDTAQPYKFRGKARKMLGQWEEAYKDLTTAEKLDYDDDIHEMLRQVKPNAMKIIEHNRKYERKREERELKERKERVRKAKEAQEKAKAEQPQSSGGFPGGMPRGFPGAGGMPGFPGAGGMPGFPGAGAGASGLGSLPDIQELLQDPEIMAAFADPEVAKAFQEISTNPANIAKYQGNPKIQKIIQKMSQKFGGGGANPGGSGESPQAPPTADFGID